MYHLILLKRTRAVYSYIFDVSICVLCIVLSTAALNCIIKRSSEKVLACAAVTDESKEPPSSSFSNLFKASITDSGVCSAKNTPVFPSQTVSQAPPLPNAITGLPHGWHSRGARPKSSSAQNISARHF